MPDDEQLDSGGEDDSRDGGPPDDQSDDPGPIGVGNSIRGDQPPGTTRKATLDRDDPGPIGLRHLIEEERPRPEQ